MIRVIFNYSVIFHGYKYIIRQSLRSTWVTPQTVSLSLDVIKMNGSMGLSEELIEKRQLHELKAR